jgi:hypothetical protein
MPGSHRRHKATSSRHEFRAADPATNASCSRAAGSAERTHSDGSRRSRQSGQSAVEFALVVPFICALVIVLVDFGKSMSYWLDVTQVANEGARLAAVNGDTSTLRDRLKSWELRTGNATSGGDAAVITICVGGSGNVGDPVTVRLTSDYKWFSFPSWIPIAGGGTWTIKGSATMRLEQPATPGCVTS